MRNKTRRPRNGQHKLEILETYANETRGYVFGESGWYEPYTDNTGRLFRSLQQEYGRCMGYVPTAGADGTSVAGWVFRKRMEYEDARSIHRREDRTYIREVWVTLRWTEQED